MSTAEEECGHGRQLASLPADACHHACCSLASRPWLAASERSEARASSEPAGMLSSRQSPVAVAPPKLPRAAAAAGWRPAAGRCHRGCTAHAPVVTRWVTCKDGWPAWERGAAARVWWGALASDQAGGA